MSMPALKWYGRKNGGNLRSWAISLVTVLFAVLVIAAIAEWAPRPRPASTSGETGH